MRGNVDNFKGKRRVAKNNDCEHKSRAHYARGLCNSCYTKEFNKGYKKPQSECSRCKRIRPQATLEFCQTCYLITKKEEVKRRFLDKQLEKCAVSGCDTDTSNYQLKNWHLDHDHSCCPVGKWWMCKCARGVLCRRCNLVLGHIEKAGVALIDGLVSYIGGK